MKSEHRHELKTNDLGRWATEVGHSAEKYTGQIIAGVVGVLLIGAIAVYWQSSSKAAASAGWNEMAAAQNAEDFANIADKYPGTSVSAWARLREAEMHLATGMRLSFTDRASGVSDLKKSREAFEKLVSDDSVPADAKERALFGLGRCLESLSSKNLDEPIAAYQRLVTEYPYSAYKTAAEARIAALRTGGAQDFYAWWHEQNPKPVDRELPRDMAAPGGPILNPGAAVDPFNIEDASPVINPNPSDPAKSDSSTPAEKSEAPKSPEPEAAKDAAKPADSPSSEKTPEKSNEPAAKE
ncbi:MAG: tol-pal system YbgF family protein [Planctomycetaceae bacterium]